MSPFNFEEQFPTLKRIGGGLSRFVRWLVRIFAIAPARFARRRYKPILAVIAILILAHGAVTLVLGRRVRAEIEAIRARGEPVSMADLAGPKIPDAENGAVVYAKAFQLIPRSTAGQAEMDAVLRFLKPREREKDPSLWTQAEKVCSRYRRVFPLIKEAASRPKCRFPVNWSAGSLAEFRHRSNLKALARLLRARALLDARSGKAAKALRTVELGFRLGEALKDEPTLVSQLVRVDLIGTASGSLRDVFGQTAPSVSEAKRLFDLLGRMDMADAFPNAVKGERALGIWCFRDALRNGLLIYALTSSG